MSKVTDTSYASHGTPAGTDWLVSVKAATPEVNRLLMSDLRDYMGLVPVAASPTTAGVTGVINTLHLFDISGLTASRNFTLPSTAAVGDRVGVYLTTGDSSYELILIGDTGDTINGGAAATEWSRLFISNEFVVFRCITASSAWIVEYDGRIPQQTTMRLGTAATSETVGTWTPPTTKSGVWTADVDIGNGAGTASDKITARRAGNFTITASGHTNGTSAATTEEFGVGVWKNGTVSGGGTLVNNHAHAIGVTGGYNLAFFSAANIPLAAGDYLVYHFYNNPSARGLLACASPRLNNSFQLCENL